MFQREDFLESSDTFRSLNHYRNLLHKFQSTADFMFNVSLDLLNYAATIVVENQHDTSVIGVGEALSATEVERLISLRFNLKRNRVHFLTALMVCCYVSRFVGIYRSRLGRSNTAYCAGIIEAVF